LSGSWAEDELVSVDAGAVSVLGGKLVLVDERRCCERAAASGTYIMGVLGKSKHAEQLWVIVPF